MAASAALGYDAAIHDFKAKMQQCTMRAVCGRSYVLSTKLKEWLRSSFHYSAAQYITQAARLLRASFPRNETFQPNLSKKICSEDQGALLVFSILLELGRGELIECFHRINIVDRHLPMDLLSLKMKLRDQGLRDSDNIAIMFDELQWRFCAIKFDLEMGQNYLKQQIIPICTKQVINEKGRTAKLWEIHVQEEFVDAELRQVVSSGRFNSDKDNLGYRYQFALKSFSEGHKRLYLNERHAFRGLREHEGMIRYLGEYEQKETQQPEGSSEPVIKQTFNILLEYGELDLDENFLQRLPPVFQPEIGTFWKALFEVAYALGGVHNLNANINEFDQNFHGCHLDIKPDNILLVRDRFKLADPGFAKFVREAHPNAEEMVMEQMGGTKTFGAPKETEQALTLSQGKAIDIWSLGCVFSVAATWVVMGPPGIRQFHQLRQNAIKKVTGEGGDYFHNGRQVLDAVKDWHNVVRKVLRKSDTVTGQVLDLVDKKMLVGSVEERAKAEDICVALRQIATQTDAQPRVPMTEGIMKTLLEIEERAASVPSSGPALVIPQHSKSHKSTVFDLTEIKTAHRSEYLKSALSAESADRQVSKSRDIDTSNEPSQQAERPLSSQSRPEPTPLHHARTGSQPQDTPHSQSSGIQHVVSGTSITPLSSPASRPLIRKTFKTRPPQNMFQARQEIKSRGEHKYTRHFRKLKKDELLSSHFKDRDIKFLVDNAGSMAPYWYEATYLLETLVMKAVGQDEDGMDLLFTAAGNFKLKNEKHAQAFVDAMKNEQAVPKDDTHTDIRKPLGDIFHKYLSEVKKAQKSSQDEEVKNLTVIILTDGIWAGMKSKNEVNQQIVNFVIDLTAAIGDHLHRPVSIEFIQFGDDEDATHELRDLDDNLKFEGIPDIIDTERCLVIGDVNKMLLGSFVELYDEEDDEDPAGPGSPGGGPGQSSEYSYIYSPTRQDNFASTPSPRILPEQTMRATPPIIGPYAPPSRTGTQQTTETQRTDTSHVPALNIQRPRSGFFGHRSNNTKNTR